MMFRMASYDREEMEERIQDLEIKQEETISDLDYILELLDPAIVDTEDYKENISEAIKVVKYLIKEMKK